MNALAIQAASIGQWLYSPSLRTWLKPAPDVPIPDVPDWRIRDPDEMIQEAWQGVLATQPALTEAMRAHEEANMAYDRAVKMVRG